MPSKFNKVSAPWNAVCKPHVDIEDLSPPSSASEILSLEFGEEMPMPSLARPAGAQQAGRSVMRAVPKISVKDPTQFQFWRAHDVLQEIFATHDGFQLELGSNPFKFFDIGCAPGGFAQFLLDHDQCIGGVGLSLPVEHGGLQLNISDSRMQYVMEDILKCTPQQCCGKELVDLSIADASYFRRLSSCPALHRNDDGEQAHRDIKDFGGVRSQNPFLGNWAILLQELWLGLSSLGEGGVLIFRFAGVQACSYDWHLDACVSFLTFVDGLFASTAPFKPEDKVCYVVCRGFRRTVFEATDAAEALRQSSLEILQHGAVKEALNVKLFSKMRMSHGLAPKGSWIQDVYGKATKSGKAETRGVGERSTSQVRLPSGASCAVKKTASKKKEAMWDVPWVEGDFCRHQQQTAADSRGEREVPVQSGRERGRASQDVPTPSTSCDVSIGDAVSEQSESSSRSSSPAALFDLGAMPLPVQLLGKQK